MTTTRKIIGIMLVAVLGAAPALANMAYAENASRLATREESGRETITNGALTVVATAEGKHPQFFWYANNLNNTIYKVTYRGIVEFLDIGQGIFQRKNSAELERFIRTGEEGLRAINASKIGKNITLSGAMAENRDRNTANLYNYTLHQGTRTIGVNVTGQTLVRGDFRGEVIIRGTILQSGQVLYVKASSITGLEFLRADLRQSHHPSLFEFNQGKWNFSGFQPIQVGSKVIGYQFTYTLSKVNNKFFDYLENQLVIRNRLYNFTVQEGNITVTKASMKTDIIIKQWKWELNSTEGKLIDIPLSRDQIALWLELTAFRASKVDDAMADRAERTLTDMQSGDRKIETRENLEKKGDDEKELETHGREGRIMFLSQDKALGGYFNFSNTALVYPRGGNPMQGNTVKVHAAFMPDEHNIKLYLVYPNFGANSLEHDPQIGVVGEEPVKAEYAVNPESLQAQKLPGVPQPPVAQAPQPAPLPAPQLQQPIPAPVPVPQQQSPAQAQAPVPASPSSTQGDNTMLLIGGVVGVMVMAGVAIAIRRRR